MFDEKYYESKREKLQQKLVKTKDTFIVDMLNMAQRLANEIQEIQAENVEIGKMIEENKPKEKKGK